MLEEEALQVAIGESLSMYEIDQEEEELARALRLSLLNQEPDATIDSGMSPLVPFLDENLVQRQLTCFDLKMTRSKLRPKQPTRALPQPTQVKLH